MVYTPFGVLAVVYDIHGNLPALEAVLEDAGPVDGYVLGGDYAVFGGWPRETVERLRELPSARWIRGNVDRWCADPSAAPEDAVVRGALAACREALGDPLTADLAALTEAVVVEGTRFVHASPLSDVRSFLPEPAEGEEELLAGMAERRLVLGHTHLPFRRVAAGVELVNPGSVGLPFDGDRRAAYAVIDDDGAIEHRRVAYDHERAAARLAEAFGGSPWAATVAARLRAARIDAA